MKILYDNYQSNEENPKVSYVMYLQIFKTTGRKFKKPHTDTCRKCDEWDIQLAILGEGEKRDQIDQLYNEHLDRAEGGYNKLRQE